MSTQKPCAQQFNFPYTTCRNITPPGESKYKVLTGYAPAGSFIGLPDDENVRKYLLDKEGQRKQPSNVHRAIRDTLENNSDQFPVLNGGIVILSATATVDDKKRVIVLRDGETKVSIINGSQTRGELREFLKKPCDTDQQQSEPIVHFQIVETQDKDLANEISIARNFQNKVAHLSILGKRENLEDLEKAIQETIPEARLRKSETDNTSEEDLPTEKVLQVCFALLPDELFVDVDSKKSSSKTSTYSSKAKWLGKFGELVENEKKANGDREKSDRKSRQYKCILDIAGASWQLYTKWKKHQSYSRHFRSTRAGKPSAVNDDRVLMDGMVFPVIAAFSVFVTERKGKWVLDIPTDFSSQFEDRLVNYARTAYQQANSNPQVMGRTATSYSLTLSVTEMYVQMKKAMGK